MTSERRKELDLMAIENIKPNYTPFRGTSEMVYYISAWVFGMAKKKSLIPEPTINSFLNNIANRVEHIELYEKIFEHQSKINVDFEVLMLKNKDLKSKSKEELIELIDQMYKLHLGLK